nr:MAG TPA: hypothetical protein [Bacteriophage sp.]
MAHEIVNVSPCTGLTRYIQNLPLPIYCPTSIANVIKLNKGKN